MSTTKKIFGFMLVMITTFTVLLSCCSATVYKVGDSDGWTAKDDTYYNWAKGKEFHVGDSLVFEYDRNVNDVTQVSGALELEFCDSSSPKAVYNTGNDVVTLKEPGYHHFISSNQSQCTLGQRLDVLVVHDPSRPIPPPLPRKILPLGQIYKVGDSEGWKVYDSEWSEAKQFHVGETISFSNTTMKSTMF
ncbi:Mavicyanin [Cardamine amara subsp. amara]|uniref:Mavicyanin n=1 Tax=Cardamine amara subsp. amara TaxID=228776 RepID=A0ABD1BSR0_CARAN